MAIIIGQEEKRKSWMVIAGVVLFFIALVAATYYLFFSPSPLIEQIVVPAAVEQSKQIANIDISVKAIQGVLDDPITAKLKIYAPQLTQDQTGRANPFLSIF